MDQQAREGRISHPRTSCLCCREGAVAEGGQISGAASTSTPMHCAPRHQNAPPQLSEVPPYRPKDKVFKNASGPGFGQIREMRLLGRGATKLDESVLSAFVAPPPARRLVTDAACRALWRRFLEVCSVVSRDFWAQSLGSKRPVHYPGIFLYHPRRPTTKSF